MKKADLATYIGLIGGAVVLLWGMVKGSRLSLFWDFPSVLITVGGSLASMFINHDLNQIKNMFKNMALAFSSFNVSAEEIIEMFVDLAKKARREGLLGLEDDINRLDDPFFSKGIQMMVDAIDPEVIRNILQTDIDCMVERHEENIGVIKAWAALAPAFGMIGTLIGLIQMLDSLDDPAALGPGMAVALITTFYGSLLANFVLTPIAGKLEKRNADEVLIKSLILEGIIGIQSGLNPRILEEKLKAFLPKSKVAALNEATEATEKKGLHIMPKRKKSSGGGETQAWLNTYADMVTLLLTFFVLLYSFSNLDTSKFNTFLASFKGQGVLNFGDEAFEEYSAGPYFEPSENPLANDATSYLTIDAKTAQTVEMVQNFIEEMGLEAEVTVQAEERGVALNIKDRILFDSGKADLKPEAKAILDPLAKLFGTIKQEIWVEGHTDNRPIRTKEYPTNWELSTARSSRVIRYFVENKGLDPKKFVAIGYGEYRPVAPNDSPEHMQQNRRVVMIIRMPANETEVNSNE